MGVMKLPAALALLCVATFTFAACTTAPSVGTLESELDGVRGTIESCSGGTLNLNIHNSRDGAVLADFIVYGGDGGASQTFMKRFDSGTTSISLSVTDVVVDCSNPFVVVQQAAMGSS
jgi:hypothetical protein